MGIPFGSQVCLRQRCRKCWRAEHWSSTPGQRQSVCAGAQPFTGLLTLAHPRLRVQTYPKASVTTSELLLFRHLFGIFSFSSNTSYPSSCKPWKATWPWRTPTHETLIKQHWLLQNTAFRATQMLDRQTEYKHLGRRVTGKKRANKSVVTVTERRKAKSKLGTDCIPWAHEQPCGLRSDA